MNLTQSQPTDHLLRLGFVVGLPPECLTNSKALLTCSDWRLRLSGYYLRLIWADKPFEITLFPSVGQVWEAMESGRIDLYLVGHPLDENLVRRLYPTAMLYRSVDVLFTRAPDVSISPENPFAFWLNLFARDTWICLLVFLMLLVLLHIFIERVTVGNVRKVTAVFRPSTPNQSRRSADNRYDLTKKVFESCFLVFALLMAIYDSNAKAMLYTTNSKAPFVSLDDLAAQIRRGEKRMVLERRDTDRWRMLNNPNETDYASIKNLRNAVVETDGALIYIPNVNDLCRQLSLNPDLVYFGSEKITESSCPEYCLWKFEMTREELAKPVYFVVSRRTLERRVLDARMLNMYMDSMPNYGDVESKRGHRSKGDCGASNSIGAAYYINMDSLIAFVYIGVCVFGVGAVLLILEIVVWRIRKREEARVAALRRGSMVSRKSRDLGSPVRFS